MPREGRHVTSTYNQETAFAIRRSRIRYSNNGWITSDSVPLSYSLEESRRRFVAEAIFNLRYVDTFPRDYNLSSS